MTSHKKKRIVVLALLIFGLFSLLIAQFYRIQIIEGEHWAKQADRQHYFIVKEPFLRGTFYSNTSIKPDHPEKLQPLVVDIQKFHLFIDPDSIPLEQRDAIAEFLVNFLNLSEADGRECREQFDVKSRSRRLWMWLDRSQKEEILQWWTPYSRKHRVPRNALFFVSDYQRSYPYGHLLGQVLHTVQAQKDEVTKQAVPTGGLEYSMNEYLQGKEGKRSLMRSPRNQFETGEVITKPENGADIYLTINHYLQAIAEEELEKGVKKRAAKGGWAVMMDPFTGEILALAQYPFFNPAEFREYFSEPEKLDATRFHGVIDSYEPGSIMKPLTAAIAMHANAVLRQKGEPELFSPEEKMATLNVPLKGRRKPLEDARKHSFLNMNMAIQKSSNVYASRLAERIIARFGPKWYRAQICDIFGFSKKTGVELPSESAGVLPTPGKVHPNGALEWSGPTPYALSFGHNLQATCIQIARAYAVLANGGKFVTPTLIRKIVKTKENGERIVLVDNTSPERRESFPRVLDQEIVDRVVTALKYVTKPGGSSSSGEVWGYTEAGKSGTANKIVGGTYSETAYCSSFAGFAPLSHPSFVLVVTLDEPKYGFISGVGKVHHGGKCSAPIFSVIAARALAYLGVEPDDPHGYSVNDPRYDLDKADWKKETRLLKEMYEKWNNISQAK